MVSIVIYFSYFYLWVMLSNFLKFFLTIVPYAGREYLSSVFGRKYQMIPTGVNTICLFFEFHTLSVTQRLRRRNPPTSLRWLHPPRRDLDPRVKPEGDNKGRDSPIKPENDREGGRQVGE